MLDLELVARCCHGDPDGWTTLLPFIHEVGRRVLRRFDFSEADRDDVLATVVTELYRGGLRKFRGESIGELVNFLKRAVRYRALDLVKELERRVGLDVLPERGDPGPASSIGDAECEEFLREEVQRLSRPERELYLQRAQGLKEREIAEQTLRPLGTVSAQVARLIALLRERLAARGC